MSGAVAGKPAGPGGAKLVVLQDAEILARRGAAWLLNRVIEVPGRIAVCLAGGETPKRLYSLLTEFPYRDCLPWERVHWFFGDERFVPANNPRSNFRMLRETLFARAPVPPDNIHPVPTDGTADEAAARYAVELQWFHGTAELSHGRPLFAATLLGFGDNGHTVSLFPGTPALRETRRWAVAVSAGVPEPRITLTYPALDSSAAVAFLVSGTGKRTALHRLWQGADVPAAHIAPVGSLTWFVDRDAAGDRR